MKNSFKILTILLVLTSLSLVGCGKKKMTTETVLAEFDWGGKHHIVTIDEMEKEISELPKYQQEKYSGKKGREEYLTLMAESRVLLCLAEDIKLSDEEILKKVDEYRHQLMVEKISKMEVDDKVKKWMKEKSQEYEAELRKYYEENKGKYLEPEQVKLILIMLRDEEQANEVFNDIKGGKDISEVAKELGKDNLTAGKNQDGVYLVRKGDFSGFDDFLEAAFSMENEQMTDEVIKQEVDGPRGTETYYMMFKKLEHKKERQKELEEEDVRTSVERTVKRNKEEERMEEWVESLRQKAKLQTFLEKVTVPTTEEEKEEAKVEQKPEEPKEEGTTSEQPVKTEETEVQETEVQEKGTEKTEESDN